METLIRIRLGIKLLSEIPGLNKLPISTWYPKYAIAPESIQDCPNSLAVRQDIANTKSLQKASQSSLAM